MCSFALAGIGDGGNELGMGKVRDIVKAKMPKGELIACDVAADFAVTAGEYEPSRCTKGISWTVVPVSTVSSENISTVHVKSASLKVQCVSISVYSISWEAI